MTEKGDHGVLNRISPPRRAESRAGKVAEGIQEMEDGESSCPLDTTKLLTLKNLTVAVTACTRSSRDQLTLQQAALAGLGVTEERRGLQGEKVPASDPGSRLLP